MRVKVRFFTTLRELVGEREVEVEFAGDTVKELLKHLSEKYGRKFVEYVYDETGDVRKYLILLVNGRSITCLERFETKLKDNNIIAILPPVGGG